MNAISYDEYEMNLHYSWDFSFLFLVLTLKYITKFENMTAKIDTLDFMQIHTSHDLLNDLKTAKFKLYFKYQRKNRKYNLIFCPFSFFCAGICDYFFAGTSIFGLFHIAVLEKGNSRWCRIVHQNAADKSLA